MPRSRVEEHGVLEHHSPAVRREEAGDDIDRRGLAAAGRPEQCDDAGGRQLEPHVERKGAESLARQRLEQHQRPSIRRTRRANHSDTSKPPSPSTTDRIASRAAAYSPPGSCNAEYSASGSVRVSPGMFDTNVMTAPNSPNAAEKAVIAPASKPGQHQRQSDRREPIECAGAQGARRILEAAIDVFQGYAYGTDHQRKRHHRGGERRAVAGEDELDAEQLSSLAPIGPRVPNSSSST